MPRNFPRILSLWAPPAAAALAIFLASSIPTPVQIPMPGIGDKFIHFGVYATSAFLLQRAMTASGSNSKIWLITAAIVGCYGISDEIHQLFVPGRFFEIWDILADFLGATAGALIYDKIRVFSGQKREH